MRKSGDQFCHVIILIINKEEKKKTDVSTEQNDSCIAKASGVLNNRHDIVRQYLLQNLKLHQHSVQSTFIRIQGNNLSSLLSSHYQKVF